MKTLSRKLPVAAFSLTLLAAAMLPVAQPVQAAATALQRCEGANGEVVYTDKACAAFGAASVPMSGELLTRIAYEEAKTYEDASLAPADRLAAPAAVAPSRRSAASGCARTPTQLSMDLQGALALGDDIGQRPAHVGAEAVVIAVCAFAVAGPGQDPVERLHASSPNCQGGKLTPEAAMSSVMPEM